MEHFSDKILKQCVLKKSFVVVGLDPSIESFPVSLLSKFPNTIDGIADAIVEFNCRIIDSVFDLVPAIKPQIAFYERFGVRGIEAFVKTVNYGKEKGLVVIEDAKRNDISSTAKAYSDGHLGRADICGKKFPCFDVDAITVTPYLGSDGIYPFVEDVKQYGKGIFVLVKTSNKSSSEIQNLKVVCDGRELFLFEVVGRFVENWGSDCVGELGYSSVGAVVGGTFPDEAKINRRIMPRAIFLVPGYGTQGGTASSIANFFNDDGFGALISSSRSINYAYKLISGFSENNYGEAARKAVVEMNISINRELQLAKLLIW